MFEPYPSHPKPTDPQAMAPRRRPAPLKKACTAPVVAASSGPLAVFQTKTELGTEGAGDPQWQLEVEEALVAAAGEVGSVRAALAALDSTTSEAPLPAPPSPLSSFEVAVTAACALEKAGLQLEQTPPRLLAAPVQPGLRYVAAAA